jgi:hypothetical protein
MAQGSGGTESADRADSTSSSRGFFADYRACEARPIGRLPSLRRRSGTAETSPDDPSATDRSTGQWRVTPVAHERMFKMLQLLSHLQNALRSNRARKSPRPFTPAVAPLEDRVLLQFNSTLTAKPNVLWPPKGQYVPVQLSGTFTEFTVVTPPHGSAHVVFEELPGPKQGVFQIIDEYRRNQLDGLLNLTDEGGGHFSFQLTVYLQAQRRNEFPQGRRYYITVAARDEDGWSGQTIPVWVPHALPAPPRSQASVTPAHASARGHL